jgi:arylsulfate sulfotransferase
MRKLLLIFTFIIFSSCQYDDLKSQIDELSHEIIALQEITDVLELKILINNAYQTELLITELIELEDSIILVFVDGTSYEVSNNIIIGYQIEGDNWLLNLTLTDTTVISTYIVGDELNISEHILNPFEISPLTSIINIETPISGRFISRVVGQDGLKSDMIITSEYYGTNHSLNIYGLYPNYENQIELTFVNNEGVEIITIFESIITDILPPGMPDLNVISHYDEYNQNTMILFNYRPTHIPFMADPLGKIRWYLNESVPKYALQRFKNGNFGYGKQGLNQGSIFEFTIMGEYIQEYSFYPQFENAHHDVYEMSNENFLVAVNKVGIETIEDHILEIDRESGQIINIWDLREILQMDRFTLAIIGDGSDWFHTNAVIHDESDNTLIISGQPQGTVKVTWDNQLKWILSPHDGWDSEYQDYLLQPTTGNEFEYSWGQHAPLILPNGNLMQFDNGFGREFGNASSDYSRIVEYEINENANNVGGTVSQIWQYGKERGENMFSPFLSDVDYLEDTSSMFINCGTTAYDIEYVSNLEQIFTPNIGQIETLIIEVNSSKEVLFEMALSSNANGTTYRAEKLIL